MSMTLRAEFTSASSAEQEMNKRKKKLDLLHRRRVAKPIFFSIGIIRRSVLHAIRDFDFILPRDSELNLGKTPAKNGRRGSVKVVQYASFSTYFCALRS